MSTPTPSIRYPAQTSANIDRDSHRMLYQQSIEAPNVFWAEQAKRLDWIRSPSKIKNCSFAKDLSLIHI